MKYRAIFSIFISLFIHAGIFAGLSGWLRNEKESTLAGGVTWYNLNPGGGGGGASQKNSYSEKKALSEKKIQRVAKASPPENDSSTSGKKIGEGEGKGAGEGSGEGAGGNGPLGFGNGEGAGNPVLSKIKSKIARAKRYPLEARRERVEGICAISFEINPDGSSRNLELLQSSGHPLLDQEALSTIQRASPFPYYPKPIKLNLKYSLR